MGVQTHPLCIVNQISDSKIVRSENLPSENLVAGWEHLVRYSFHGFLSSQWRKENKNNQSRCHHLVTCWLVTSGSGEVFLVLRFLPAAAGGIRFSCLEPHPHLQVQILFFFPSSTNKPAIHPCRQFTKAGHLVLLSQSGELTCSTIQ